MERALLDGEHQTEMEQLHEDEEKINQLKHRQRELIDESARERENVSFLCFLIEFVQNFN